MDAIRITEAMLKPLTPAARTLITQSGVDKVHELTDDVIRESGGAYQRHVQFQVRAWRDVYLGVKDNEW
jgi:hypothetical protein